MDLMKKLEFTNPVQKKRYDLLLPKGIPRYVRIYDNEGKTADCYTCVFGGRYTRKTGGSYWYSSFSVDPFHPQGIGQHGDSPTQIDVAPGAWSGVSIGRMCHLGRRIKFEDLPENGQKFVMQDYLYLNDFTDEHGKICDFKPLSVKRNAN